MHNSVLRISWAYHYIYNTSMIELSYAKISFTFFKKITLISRSTNDRKYFKFLQEKSFFNIPGYNILHTEISSIILFKKKIAKLILFISLSYENAKIVD